MYESFDMACHDEDQDLRLNIKVNSENLLPIPQKYNLGSLRLPADPSWPKIPQRRLADDVGDLIQTPCIATLNGTPRRSRTIVQSPQSQSFDCKTLGNVSTSNDNRSNNLRRSQIPHNHQLRSRKSGSSDPRFKKVTTSVKSQMTSTDPIDDGDDKIEKKILARKNIEEDNEKSFVNSWRESNRAQVVIQQKAERPDETKLMESIGVQTDKSKDESCKEFIGAVKSSEIQSRTDKSSAGIEKNVQNESRIWLKNEQPVNETKFDSNNHSGVEKTPENLPKLSQTTNYASVSDNPEPLSSDKDDKPLTNSYSIKVPLLSYENVPVQISAEVKSKNIDEKPFKYFDNRFFSNSAMKLSSGTDNIFDNIDVPKLEIPNDVYPEFSNFIDNQNCKGNLFSGQHLQKSSTIGSKNKIDDSKLILKNVNQCDRISSKNNPKNVSKNFQIKRFKSVEKKIIPNISGDNFIPKHEFHIYHHHHHIQEEKKFQSYRTVTTTDSELDNKSADSVNRNKEKIEDEITVSESSEIANEESLDHEPIVKSKTKKQSRYNISENQDSRKFESPNNKTVYFKEPKARTKIPIKLYKKWVDREQLCRSSSSRQKRKIKSDQDLMLSKNRVQSSEPQITSNQRLSKTPCLKKANSYLSRCTQEVTPDSETSCAPENREVRPSSRSYRANEKGKNLNESKREHCMKPYERPFSKSRAKLASSSDLKKNSNNKLISVKSPRGETDLPMKEKPTAIPVKTQKLLNKSYWEYYNKLKSENIFNNGENHREQCLRKVAKKRRTPEEINGEPNTSQTGDKMELSLPEIRTLEQCSVLSTMINKTLDSTIKNSSETIRTKQIYLNGNMRSSSDPTAGTQSAILKKLFSGDNDGSILSSTLLPKQKHHKQDKKFDVDDKNNNNGSLKLKSIVEHPVVFFGCMLYALIVFLPMVYDYFFYEEHDEYEDLSYLEIFFEYGINSFADAFGQFFDILNRIFFKPDARMQRLSSGRWRQKISRHYLDMILNI